MFLNNTMVSCICATAWLLVISSPAQAQLVKEAIKQTGKVIARESVEAGTKNVAKQTVKLMAREAAEASTKTTASALAKGGIVDDVANALARNKGVIVGGAALGTAMANSDKVIAATSDVLTSGIDATATNIAQPIVTKATEGVNWFFWIVGLGWLGCGACLLYSRVLIKPRIGLFRSK